MKIIYGVAGQGFGHAMRSKKVIEHLIKKGHEVKVITYGQAFPVLKEQFDCVEITGLHLYYHNNKMSYLRTAWKNLRKAHKLSRDLKIVKNIFKSFDPHIVFSDYEPNTAYYAKFFHKPLASVGNHNFITNCQINFPHEYKKDYLAVSAYTKAVTPFADKYFVLSFADVKPKDEKTVLVNPIVQDDIKNAVATEGDHILVYLTSEYHDVVAILKKFDNKFIVYGLNKDELDENVEMKKFSREGFVHDLATSKGVIANAGFSLISEALYLSKPYFALPVKSQFEQTINGIYLQQLGYGEYHHEINEILIADYLNNLGKYKNNLQNYNKRDALKVWNLIDKFVSQYDI